MERTEEMTSQKRKRNNSEKGAKHISPVVKDNIKRLFERKFVYQNQEDLSTFVLPSVKHTVEHSAWEVQEYIGMKKELNDLKNKLNDKDMVVWHEHTRSVNPAATIGPNVRVKFRPELCTVAWCKFYEIASTYLQIDAKAPFFCVHLCEAPGAFVTSLNHYLLSCGHKGSWSWLATTLNPYYEGNSIRQMINDDRFIRYTHSNWYFGVDGTGNLMSAENLSGLREKLQDTRVDLVTADGSIDCQGDPAEQENVVSRLQYCEAITAMHILSPGGTFVVKMFTMFECQSICLMYLLNCVFEKVNVFKPCTSKGGNSEVYVVCVGYKGRAVCESYLTLLTELYFGDDDPKGCIFDMADIPAKFFTQHKECIEFFMDSQMTCIQRNLDLCHDLTEVKRSELELEQEYCMECFFARYHIEPMVNRSRIMKAKKQWSKQATPKQTELGDRMKLEGKFIGSFEERQRLSKLPWKQKVFQYETFEEEVEKEDNSLWIQGPTIPLQDREVFGFTLQTGRPVGRIHSSSFCHDYYIVKTQEILDNVQWLRDYTRTHPEFAEVIAQRLLTSLSSALPSVDQRTQNVSQIQSDNESGVCVCKNGTDLMEVDFREAQTDRHAANTEAGTFEQRQHAEIRPENGGLIDLKEQCVLMCQVKCQCQNGHSPLCQRLRERTSGTGAIVRLYSVASDTVGVDFELAQQRALCEAVTDIMQGCDPGDTVVLEMGSCLTRFTVGLVYLLYRTFRQIGFVHHHGNLLKRHLVCTSYQSCPSSLHQCLSEACEKMSQSHSEALLEIVPLYTILEDQGFTSFLHISNTNLLQSFITTVINQERQLCVDQ